MMTTTEATAAVLAEPRVARRRAVALEALAERPGAEAAQLKPYRAVLLVVAARLRPAKVARPEAKQRALPIAEERLRRAQAVAEVQRRIQAVRAAPADGRKVRRAAEQAALAARLRCSPTLRSCKS